MPDDDRYDIDDGGKSRKLAIRLKILQFFSRETSDLHVGLHGSQRLPAQLLLPPDRRTVETTLGHTVSHRPPVSTDFY